MILTTRPSLSRTTLVLLTLLWTSLIPNATTLNAFAHSPSAGEGLSWLSFMLGGYGFILTCSFVFLGILCVLTLITTRYILPVFLAGWLILAAVLSYHTYFLGAQFDRTMLMNMLQTHPGEALELLNPKLIIWVLVVGILPAVFVLRLRIAPTPAWKFLLQLLLTGSVLMVVTLALVFAQYARYASATRNHDFVFHTIAPINIMAAGVDLMIRNYHDRSPHITHGEDAAQKYALKKPRLIVLVLGETARAANHGINGYERDTTPRMRQANGIYFPNTISCGTATAISVPCIFSGVGQEKFNSNVASHSDTLVDVIQRTGARVLWRDNDGGCKGVCKSATVTDYSGAIDKKWCPEAGNCYDEILLSGLRESLLQEKRDTFLTLHLKGSHGPAYYKRYPPTFEAFRPTCQSTDLASCDPKNLRNAYDNTIVYSDHVVGETIELLKGLSQEFATSLVYVSDHGESLGEKGLYLHGLPYAIAPIEQTRVPLFVWSSPEFLKMEDWDWQCMRAQNSAERSHDNIYHTLLGLLDISTVEYKKELDIFAICDRN